MRGSLGLVIMFLLGLFFLGMALFLRGDGVYIVVKNTADSFILNITH